MRVSPFRDLRINGYLLLPEAFRSLSRLSSALSAKASALRPSSLDLFLAIFYQDGCLTSFPSVGDIRRHDLSCFCLSTCFWENSITVYFCPTIISFFIYFQNSQSRPRFRLRFISVMCIRTMSWNRSLCFREQAPFCTMPFSCRIARFSEIWCRYLW